MKGTKCGLLRRTAQVWALSSALVAPALAGGPDEEQGPDHAEPEHDSAARLVEFDRSAFGQDPDFGETWDGQEQWDIYGAKSPVTTQRPLLEWGRPLYQEGPFKPGEPSLLGERNLLFPHLMVYGDWRTAAGYNTGGADLDGDGASDDFGQISTRLNLDIDLALTATERIHAFVQPFERNGDISRFEFGDRDEEELNFDLNLDALFFEGDLGALVGGSDGTVSDFDMPFSVGLMPLLFQNGVWVEDAFTGVAVTVPAKNSPSFNISNFDVTFFAGFDKVNSGGVLDAGGNDSDATLVGATAFVEAMEGYWEVGYGFTSADSNAAGVASDADYHNLTAAFTRRYWGWLSNSVRAILNFGQDDLADFDGDGDLDNTADGVLLLVENSFVTKKPYTLVPYVNLFAGFGTPQSLARGAAAGGVLKNTGLNFEADVMTGFPSLDATGHDSVGAAVGIQYLFDLEHDLLVEVAGQHGHGDDQKTTGDEFAFGVRWQKPLSHRWILRADAMYGFLDGGVDDISGVRLEFRWKF